MDLLKSEIVKRGEVFSEEVLKVDSFLNHQIDPQLLLEIGKEFHRIFADKLITKVLTAEASGIAVGLMTSLSFGVPLVFAKKVASRNLDKETYLSKVFSFTKEVVYDIQVSKKYLKADDHVLIVDDFLANGQACFGIIDIVKQAGATLEGVGIVIEKEFQPGGKLIRNEGVRVESLAIIRSLKDGKVEFK